MLLITTDSELDDELVLMLAAAYEDEQVDDELDDEIDEHDKRDVFIELLALLLLLLVVAVFVTRIPDDVYNDDEDNGDELAFCLLLFIDLFTVGLPFD